MVNLPWRVLVRDAARTIVGPLTAWTSLDVVLRASSGGTWTMKCPAGGHADLLGPGAGLLVVPPWEVSAPLFSGPVTELSTASGAGAPVLEVTGIDDTGLLNDRLVLPNPALGLAAQDDAAYWTHTAAGENVIRRVVHLNAGEGALAGRGFVTVSDETVADPAGATVTINSRFQPLGDAVAEMAAAARLAVRVIQAADSANLNLEIREPADLRDALTFSELRGNLESYSYRLAAPKASRVVVGGQGEGAARHFVERSSTTAEAEWSRRVEVFRDARDTDDTTTLQQRGDETLAADAATAGLAIVPVDTPGARFGIDYQLGDIVSVVAHTSQWAEYISEVRITVDADGTTIRPSVGSAELADTSVRLYRRVRDIATRTSQIERRL